MHLEAKKPNLYTELFHRHPDNPDPYRPALALSCPYGVQRRSVPGRRADHSAGPGGRPPRPFAPDRRPQHGRRQQLADRHEAQFRPGLRKTFRKRPGAWKTRADVDGRSRRLGHRLHGLFLQRAAGVVGRNEGLPHLFPLGPRDAPRGQGRSRLSAQVRQSLCDDPSARLGGQFRARTSGSRFLRTCGIGAIIMSCCTPAAAPGGTPTRSASVRRRWRRPRAG